MAASLLVWKTHKELSDLAQNSLEVLKQQNTGHLHKFRNLVEELLPGYFKVCWFQLIDLCKLYTLYVAFPKFQMGLNPTLTRRQLKQVLKSIPMMQAFSVKQLCIHPRLTVLK